MTDVHQLRNDPGACAQLRRPPWPAGDCPALFQIHSRPLRCAGIMDGLAAADSSGSHLIVSR